MAPRAQKATVPAVVREVYDQEWTPIPQASNKIPAFKWKDYQNLKNRPEWSQVKEWARKKYPSWAMVTGQREGVLVLDFDGPEGEETRKDLGLKPHIRTPSGGSHVWVYAPRYRVRGKSRVDPNRFPGMDLKAHGMLATIYGKGYRRTKTPEPYSLDDLPDELRRLIEKRKVTKQNQKPAEIPKGFESYTPASQILGEALGRAEPGSRDDTALWLACQLRDERLSLGGAEPWMYRYADSVTSLGDHPYTRQEAYNTLISAFSQPPREPRLLRGPKEAWPEPEWPKLREEAFHGLAGEVVQAIAPETEADPAALLFTFLSAYGTLLGPSPTVYAGGGRHSARIWALIVGETSRSRKSTAKDLIYNLMSRADPKMNEYYMSSLSTGEGLITHAENAQDKRLWVAVPEFARILKVGTRDGNPLFPVMCEAFDGGLLQIATKGSPLRLDDAFISVVGLIALDTLRMQLKDQDIASGFANRFMICLAKRSNVIPNPEEPDYEELAKKVRRSLRRARKIPWLKRSQRAEARWAEVYASLPDRAGFVAQLTNRAEAHMARLQLLLAAMNGSKRITTQHVDAAKAIWDYAEASARYIFGDRLGHPDAEKLLEELRKAYPEGMSHDDQYQATGKNWSAARLGEARRLLLEAGLADEKPEPTEGRPRMITRAVPHA